MRFDASQPKRCDCFKHILYVEAEGGRIARFEIGRDSDPELCARDIGDERKPIVRQRELERVPVKARAASVVDTKPTAVTLA